MAISTALKLAPDAGNQLVFGPDNGLYVSATAPRGGPHGMTIDNTMHTAAAAAPYYYWLPSGASLLALTWPANTAQLFPLYFARDCQITAGGYNISTAGAGSQVCHSIFAADAAGQPGAKVADVFQFPSATNGFKQATSLSGSTVFTGGKLYWACTWANTTSAYPAATHRTGIAMQSVLRMSDRPQVMGFFNSGVQCLLDTSVTWSGLSAAPSTVSPTPTSGTVAPVNIQTYAPHICYGIYNV